MNDKQQTAVLILENGTVMEGKSFGAQGKTIGEMVFTTSMTGYQETLTDLSFYGQILVQTFPSIGNYGVNNEDFEAEKTALFGYIVREYCDEPSNFRSTGEIDAFLKNNGVIGLYDIDTRKLTRELREHGTMNGMITTDEFDLNEALREIKAYKVENAVKLANEYKKNEPSEEYTAPNAELKLVLLDYGNKKSLAKGFIAAGGCKITVLHHSAGIDEILSQKPDGIILSCGPGSPEDISIDTVKTLIEKRIPIFGIGLGHQLIALAFGFKIKKMHQGHRGGNQPVIDLKSGKTYITAQNHGYTIDTGSIKSELAEINRINANDKSCEGMEYIGYPILSVEFYPQNLGIMNDTSYIFNEFIKIMENNKK